jgi:hypothetical protein
MFMYIFPMFSRKMTQAEIHSSIMPFEYKFMTAEQTEEFIKNTKLVTGEDPQVEVIPIVAENKITDNNKDDDDKRV